LRVHVAPLEIAEVLVDEEVRVLGGRTAPVGAAAIGGASVSRTSVSRTSVSPAAVHSRGTRATVDHSARDEPVEVVVEAVADLRAGRRKLPDVRRIIDRTCA